MSTMKNVQAYLNGVKYPADKNTIIRYAEENDAPADVLAILDYLSDRQYADPTDISSEFGGVKGIDADDME